MTPAVIAVVGSAMMDLTAYADVLPEPGQTLAGQLFTTGFGGKGANQAVMAAHCGAEVHFIGKLGKDVFGTAIADNFVKVGIHSEYVDKVKLQLELPIFGSIAMVRIESLLFPEQIMRLTWPRR